MNTIKVFISQPMKGKTNEEILAERKKAITDIKRRFDGVEIEIIDSFFKDNVNKGSLECLGESIGLLSQATVAYFISGWENARGCIIERLCAATYGIPVMEQNESKITNYT